MSDAPLDIGALRRTALLRALRKRCPQCGEGKLFVRYGRLDKSCIVCGLVFRREQGAQTGSMYLSAAVTQVFACVLIFAIWVFLDWGTALSIGVALPIVLLFCLAFLPYSQSLWVAVEYVTDAVNAESWVEPRPAAKHDA